MIFKKVLAFILFTQGFSFVYGCKICKEIKVAYEQCFLGHYFNVQLSEESKKIEIRKNVSLKSNFSDNSAYSYSRQYFRDSVENGEIPGFYDEGNKALKSVNFKEKCKTKLLKDFDFIDLKKIHSPIKDLAKMNRIEDAKECTKQFEDWLKYNGFDINNTDIKKLVDKFYKERGKQFSPDFNENYFSEPLAATSADGEEEVEDDTLGLDSMFENDAENEAVENSESRGDIEENLDHHPTKAETEEGIPPVLDEPVRNDEADKNKDELGSQELEKLKSLGQQDGKDSSVLPNPLKKDENKEVQNQPKNQNESTLPDPIKPDPIKDEKKDPGNKVEKGEPNKGELKKENSDKPPKKSSDPVQQSGFRNFLSHPATKGLGALSLLLGVGALAKSAWKKSSLKNNVKTVTKNSKPKTKSTSAR